MKIDPLSNSLGLIDRRPRPIVRASRVASVREARVKLGMFGLERIVERRLAVGIEAVEDRSYYKHPDKDAVPYWKAYKRYTASSAGSCRTADLIGLSLTRVVTKREAMMFGLRVFPVFEESLIITDGDDTLVLGTIVRSKPNHSYGINFSYNNRTVDDFFPSVFSGSFVWEAITVSFVASASSARAVEVIAPLFELALS